MHANEVNIHSAWRSLPVTLEAFDDVRDAVFALAGETPRTRAVIVACDEWIANVVNHSGTERFAFRCGQDGGVLWIVFSDDGVPFDPTADRPAQIPEFEDLELGGMGLAFIRQTASRMRYRREDGRNILELCFEMPACAQPRASSG